MEAMEMLATSSTTTTSSSSSSSSSHLPAPFLTKTYDMIEDVSSDTIVSWSSTNKSFVIWKLTEFSQVLLPRYFKHRNLSSFVRQLNSYGFHKVNPDRLEFAHENFLPGGKHLLKGIHRRKSESSVQQNDQLLHEQGTASANIASEFGKEPCADHRVSRKLGFEREMKQLLHDRCVLMAEVVRLQQEQHNVNQAIRSMVDRVEAAEWRQEQTMAFLANAMCNTDFLLQLQQSAERFPINIDLDGAMLGIERKQFSAGSTHQANGADESSRMDVNACKEECNSAGVSLKDADNDYHLNAYNADGTKSKDVNSGAHNYMNVKGL